MFLKTLFLLLLVSCRNEAVAVGDEFVNYYFVEVAQNKALPLTTGAAREALTEELRLVSLARQAQGIELARSLVNWERNKSTIEASSARIDYAIQVNAGGRTMTKRATVSLRKEGNRWLVSNYKLMDSP